MNRDEKVQYLANICCLLIADGDIDPTEQEVFEEISQGIGAGFLEREEAVRLARGPGYQVWPIGRWSQRIRNLEDMLLAVYSNGVLEPMEKKNIKEYARQLGISQEQLDLIRKESEGRCQKYLRPAAWPERGTGQPVPGHVPLASTEPPENFADVVPSGKGGIFSRIGQAIRDAGDAADARDEQRQHRRQQLEQLRLDDPVAARTEWRPAVPTGAGLCTHNLVQVSPNRVEFRPSVMGRIVPLAFILLGLLEIAIGAGIALFCSLRGGPAIFISLLFGCVASLPGCLLVGIGGILFRRMMRPIGFDRGAGWFWKGSRMPVSPAETKQRKNAVPLEQIHAVQIISEYVRDCSRRTGRTSSTRRTSYYSYEINLVLKDGARINVVDHGNLGRIQQDSRQLGEFLGVPVWDYG